MTGITFLISSGDNGVATFNNVCMNDYGGLLAGQPDFTPHVGNTCPYVTSVGATQVKSGVPVRPSRPLSPLPNSRAVPDARMRPLLPLM